MPADGKNGDGAGSTNVTLDRTTSFGINASYGPPDNPVVSRGVVAALLTVPVADTDCRTFPAPFGVLGFVDTIKSVITDAVKGQLRDAVKVVPGNGILSIAIPLSANGQGSMDITLDLWVQVLDPNRTGGQIAVTVHNLKVDVSLDFPADVCEGVATQVGQAFMSVIADKLIAAQVKDGLNAQVQQFAISAQQGDPLHRTFSLTSMVLTPDELSFTLCPP